MSVSPAGISQIVRESIHVVGRNAPKALRGSESLLHAGTPRVVVVGLGKNPPATTASLVEKLVDRGLRPGVDVIATNYSSLRLGTRGGLVKIAGEGGPLLAGKGEQTLFLMRGGGNLKPHHMDKIRAIESVEGAHLLTDSGFIERAGSKAITGRVLDAAGVPLPKTVSVASADEAIAVLDETLASGGEAMMLKKVNSLGGKDVHRVERADDITNIMGRNNDDYIMQEVIPAAIDQDIRVHMVWDSAAPTPGYEVLNSYTRNRVVGARTPNLAAGGYPTHYSLSPWEHGVAIDSANALARGSSTPPLHVGLDFFPRKTISASTVEGNIAQQMQAARGGTAIPVTTNTMVVGEAASSAGTKGTEMVLGASNNPVTDAMATEIMLRRGRIMSSPLSDATAGAQQLVRG